MTGTYVKLGDLNGFERDLLLGLLWAGPCNGQELSRVVSRLYSDPVGRSQLYTTLQSLEDSNLVNVGQDATDERSNQYHLSRRGEQTISSLVTMYSNASRELPESADSEMRLLDGEINE